MNDSRRQILQMLADGKISADEAERLLAALEESGPKTETVTNGKARYLCVQVKADPDSEHRHKNVDIKIPLVLLKAGIKIGSLMPEGAKGKLSEHLSSHGVDLDLGKLDAEKIDQLIEALRENSIDIDSDQEKVRIHCC
ncbi:MAG TPA: hypothetical protein VJ983_01360 [candidate division Zixibacteria bacterium]|nr:hypothetical protein [candidate division Zixibacteria bacterium]